MTPQDFKAELRFLLNCFRLPSNTKIFAELDPGLEPSMSRLDESREAFMSALKVRFPGASTTPLPSMMVINPAFFKVWVDITIRYHHEYTDAFKEQVEAARKYDRGLVPVMQEYWDAYNSLVYYLKSRIEC